MLKWEWTCRRGSNCSSPWLDGSNDLPASRVLCFLAFLIAYSSFLSLRFRAERSNFTLWLVFLDWERLIWKDEDDGPSRKRLTSIQVISSPQYVTMCDGKEVALLIDKISRLFFPVSFIVLNLVYWTTFLKWRTKQMIPNKIILLRVRMTLSPGLLNKLKRPSKPAISCSNCNLHLDEQGRRKY